MKKFFILFFLCLIVAVGPTVLAQNSTNPDWNCPTPFTLILRYGDGEDAAVNAEVVKVQQLLIDQGLLKIMQSPTGFFGPLTRSALKTWQVKQGLIGASKDITTIYWGTMSQARANRILCGTPTPTPTLTPTPTPTPTVTPTVTPSPTVTPTPTVTPRPTLTPTPSPSRTPIPTPTVTPNPTPTSFSFTSPTSIDTLALGETYNVSWTEQGFSQTDRGYIYLYPSFSNSVVHTPFSSYNADGFPWNLAYSPAQITLKTTVTPGYYYLVMKTSNGRILGSTADFHVGATPNVGQYKLTIHVDNSVASGYIVGGSEMAVNPVEINCGQIEQNGQKYSASLCQTRDYPAGTVFTLINSTPTDAPNTKGWLTGWPYGCTRTTWTNAAGKVLDACRYTLTGNLTLDFSFGLTKVSAQPLGQMGNILQSISDILKSLK